MTPKAAGVTLWWNRGSRQRGGAGSATTSTSVPVASTVSACSGRPSLVRIRQMISGVLAGVGALASIMTARVAAILYRQIFHEDPPE